MNNMAPSRWLAGKGGAILGVLIAAGLLLTPSHAQVPPATFGMRNDHPVTNNLPTPLVDLTPSLSPKQKMSIMKSNFQKSKNHATELAALAKDLCKELNNPSANSHSPVVDNRLEKIEKLAKKIRDETKGF